MNRLIEYFASQHTFVNIITFFVLVIGGVSLVNLKRDAFPDVSFDIVTISVGFPNASAESVEALIINPLESEMRKIEGIKEMNSLSGEGGGIIILQLDPDQISVSEAKSDALDVVDAFEELPDGALDPVVVATDSSTKGLLEVAIGADVPYPELRKVVKRLKRKIENIPGIGSVRYKGFPDFELKVEAIPEKLLKYDVSLTELINTLKQADIDVPGGQITIDGKKDFVVKTRSVADTPEQIGATVIRSNISNKHIRVRDVATVSLGFAEEEIIYRTNQRKGVNLVISKKKSADTIRVIDRLKQELGKFKEGSSVNLEFQYINDMAKHVKRRVNVLSNNMVVGLILVLLVLSLMLPFRMALVAAIGIPFSFLVAILIFHLGGISLNLISMIGLIIVMGMLVDDAVVVTEIAQKKIDEGMSPQQAAIAGTQEIWKPIATSIATTLAAFLPLMFMSGIFGKFISNLPIGVVLALLVSLGECLFILPSHIGSWVKAGKGPLLSPRIWTAFVSDPYERALRKVVKFRYITILLVLVSIVFSLWFAAKNMDFELFPGAEDDVVRLNFELEMGTPLTVTTKVTGRIERMMRSVVGSDLETTVSTVGLQPKQDMVAIGQKEGSRYAQSAFFLKPKDERIMSLDEIVTAAEVELAKISELKKFSFTKGQSGPPEGKAVTLKVIGENYQEVRDVVGNIKSYLAKIDGVTGINDSFAEGKEQIIVKLNQEKISIAGISKMNIANSIRALLDGVVVDEITQIDEKIEVVVTLPSDKKENMDSILDIGVPNKVGKMVLLRNLVSLEKQTSIGWFEHLNGLRAITIRADVNKAKASAMKVNAQLKSYTENLERENPNIQFSFGGQDKDTKESFKTLGQAFMFALLGILLLLILQFNNFHQPLIVGAIIPLGLLSVIWTFYFHGMPLSFLGIVGMIALAGVIVNNAIVFIDHANKEMERGIEAKESFIRAGVSRLRPIFLTTVTTTVGILPTGYGLGGKDDFVVPIALALGWGMFFGAVLTTFVLPTIMSIVDDIGLLFHSLKRRKV